MKSSLFQKVLTYFMLIVMNAPPIVTNLMTIRNAAVVGSSLYTVGLFANDALTDADLKLYAGDGKDFGMDLLGGLELGSYSENSNSLEIEVNGENVSVGFEDFYDTDENTGGSIGHLYDEVKNFTDENKNDDVSDSINQRRGELISENSGQGGAFRMLYGCEVGDNCDDPIRSDSWKKERSEIRNSVILQQQDEIVRNGLEIEDLTADCKIIKRSQESVSTRWIPDIKTCNQNIPTPIAGSCTLKREIQKVPAITQVTGARFDADRNEFIFDRVDRSGGGCTGYEFPVDFHIPNLNAITKMTLNSGMIDDILSLYINGVPVWSVDGRGAENSGGKGLFVLPANKKFQASSCMSIDESSINDADFIVDKIKSGGVVEDIEFCKSVGLITPSSTEYVLSNNRYYHLFLKYSSGDSTGIKKTLNGGHSNRVIRKYEDELVFREILKKSLYSSEDVVAVEGISNRASTCEYSADPQLPRFDLRPYLVEGDNTIAFRLAVGGGGNLQATFSLAANAYTDRIIESPAGCVSSPEPGWGAILDESVTSPGVGSTKRWKCVDLDNNRNFEGIPITPAGQGFMLREMFNLDDPKSDICYEADARKYQNDLSTLQNDGCIYEQDGTKKCFDPLMVDSMNANSCETKGYVQSCNFIEKTCTSLDEQGNCLSYYKKYDCGQEFVETTTTEVEDYVCPGGLQCIGESCFTQDREENRDFGKVAGISSAVSQLAKEGPAKCDEDDWIEDRDKPKYQQYTEIIDGIPSVLQDLPYLERHPGSKECNCDLKDNPDFDMNDPDSARQIIDVASCNVFAGKKYSCKEVVSGLQDCCDYPGEVSIVEYIQIAMMLDKVGAYEAAWDLAKEVPGVGTVGDTISGAGDSITGYLGDSWNSIAGSVNDGLGTDMLGTVGGEENLLSGSGGMLAGVKQNLTNAIGEWSGEVLGESASSSLFKQNEISGDYAMTDSLGSALDTFNTVMMYYQAFKLFIQIVYKCEDEEYEMGYKKKLKSCHDTGGYCDQKFLGYCFNWVNTACCYDSPLTRILNEELYRELGKDWNNGENPSCNSITVQDFDDPNLNWDNVDLSEYTEILKTSNLIPTGNNIDTLFDLDGTTKGLGRNLDEMNGTSAADPDSNSQTRTVAKTGLSDPDGDKLEQKNCFVKDYFDYSLDGSADACVFDCGVNSLWNSQDQQCQCVDGSYKDSNGKCVLNKECPSHQEFDPLSAACVQSCGFYDDELSAGPWSATVTVRGSGPNIPDTCDGDRYNPYEGPRDKQCLDVDEVGHWYGGWLGTGDRRSVYSTREVDFFSVYRCKSPVPIKLTGLDCAEVGNTVERTACNDSCSRLETTEEQKQCRSMTTNCDFSKRWTGPDLDTLVISDRSQCVNDVLGGVVMPGDMCNSYTDEVSRLACLDQCSFTAGLSMIGAFKCNELAYKCDIGSEEDKKLCIDILRNGNIKYGEESCNVYPENSDDRRICVGGVMEQKIPQIRTNVMNNWCNSNVSAGELCGMLYDQDEEIKACNIIALENPNDGDSCLSYKDNSLESVGYTPSQKIAFNDDATEMANYINTTSSMFIERMLFGDSSVSGISHVYFEIYSSGVLGNLHLMINNGTVSSENIVESYIVLNNRPSYKYGITLSNSAINTIDDYSRTIN